VKRAQRTAHGAPSRHGARIVRPNLRLQLFDALFLALNLWAPP
jgi:hypothetical protein